MGCDPQGGGEIQSTLTARNAISELARLSEFIADFGQRASLPDEFLADCELALEEIFCNVVRYGFPGGGEHSINITLSLAGGLITLTVQDDGVPFNPLEQTLVDLNLPIEERGAGGLGIHLVKGIMDELEYRRTDGHNQMIMRKKVTA